MAHACTDPATCPNPEGLCGCGCGEATGIATSRGGGRVLGCPTRYLTGHHRRKSPQDYEVDPATGCWLWLRATIRAGYAVRRRQGRNAYVHRLMYEDRFGPIPKGLELDHVCRRRHCINPDHLEAVTHTENVRRGLAAKLTRDDVEMIRELRGTVACEAMAWFLEVSPRTIRAVISGEAWLDAA